ncbi:conserved hypothetical protein [Vibrio phage 150E35-1]|nr:conserved hypothetical protein [Vibrio phage 150E35-1]
MSTTLNKFIAENVLLNTSLNTEGFELSNDQGDHPTIQSFNFDSPLRVWVEIEDDSSTYKCIMNVEDLMDDYIQEIQDIMNSVEDTESGEEDGTLVLISSQYVDIVAAVKKFIYLS